MNGYKLPDPQWSGQLRTCCKCGAVDHPIYSGEADADGSPKFVHSVQIDVMFLPKKELTKKDKTEGWMLAENGLDGGRPAKIRCICTECLDADEETSRVWKDFEKSRQEIQLQTKEQSWYAQFCQ